VLAITLLVCLGTGCVSSRSGPYIIFPRPHTPLAITNPAKVFLPCGGNPDAVEALYYCVEQGHLFQLREWVIRTQSLLNKYENATKVLNE